jgi:DNA polymerase-3 subunit epsilon
MYAIVDVETTGLSPAGEKITEIAIYVHDGQQIVEEFQSLVNPEKKIPYRIVQMTGINDHLVKDAPRFCEIAKKVVELTKDKILVGHNVRFDYSFIRGEFKSLGYDFQRKTLDTVKLSRKLIPGRRAYGLGKLCKDLGIENPSRHRAAGDAMATTRLFEMLLSIDEHPEEIKLNGCQSEVSKSLVNELPKEAGVYYFFNKEKNLIYVGKSINIRDRVLSHMNNNLHKKAVEMRAEIADVQFQITGSELLALLLESSEIKKHQPIYNRQQRRTFFNYGLYSFEDENGYLNLKVMRIVDELNPIFTYGSSQEGKDHLFRLTEEYELCQKLCGLYETSSACFHHQIKQCKGACIGEETHDSYNKKVNEALENYHFDPQNFLIIDKGRNANERSVIKVEHGKYKGFGYVETSDAIGEMEPLHDCIKAYRDNREVRQIINSYLRRNKVEKILKY